MRLFAFTKVTPHRKFNYRPAFFDPEQEKIDARNDARRIKHGQQPKNTDHASRIKGSMRGDMFKVTKSKDKFSASKFIIMAFSLILAICIVLLALKYIAYAGYLK